MKRKHIYIIGVILAAIVAGCSSSRRTVSDSRDNTVAGSPEQRFSAVLAQRDSWESVAVPVKLELKSPVGISFSGKAYFTRGKSVFVSLRKLGFEVAQLSLTPDTILLVDKFNGRYLLENITTLTSGAPVGIEDLQSLLFGQPFAVSGKLTAGSFNFFDTPTEWMAVPKNESSPLAAAFSFSNSTDVMSAAATRLFTAVYQGENRYENLRLPGKIQLAVSTSKIRIDAVLTYTWKDAEWNSPEVLRKPSALSSRYTRLEASSLLKNLK